MDDGLTIWLLAACLAPAIIYAQLPGRGGCPNVTILQSFDLNRIEGIWHYHLKFPEPIEAGTLCNRDIINSNNDGSFAVHRSYIFKKTGLRSNLIGKYKSAGPGEISLTFSDNEDARKPIYNILDTDYVSYFIIFSCKVTTPYTNSQYLWVFTKTCNPDPELVAKIKEILVKNGISQDHILPVKHEDCGENECSVPKIEKPPETCSC